MSKHRVRLDIAEDHLSLIEEVATVLKGTPKSVLHQLFLGIREAIVRNNSTVRLPPGWADAYAALQQRGAVAELENSNIDVSLLHTSLKTNSGYEGVYPHPTPGRGFIARGRVPGTSPKDHASASHLGLFPTAEEAAWARYEHYKKHDMPYGLKLEKLQDKLDKQLAKIKLTPSMAGISDYWLRVWALNDLVNMGIDVTPMEPDFQPTPAHILAEKVDGPDPDPDPVFEVDE